MFGRMSLLRFISRSLFASAFVIDGVKKVSKPSESAPQAEAFTAKVVPLLQRVVPAPYSSSIPESTETWIRVGGAAQLAGGLMFATGIGRRLGAVLLAKSSILNLAIALPGRDATKDEKDAARPQVLTSLALLGATVLAARDTQGQPSLSWRAEHAAKSVEKKISDTGSDISDSASKAAKKAEKKLSGFSDDLSRSAKKAAKKAEKKKDAFAKSAKKKAKKLGKRLDSVTS